MTIRRNVGAYRIRPQVNVIKLSLKDFDFYRNG